MKEPMPPSRQRITYKTNPRAGRLLASCGAGVGGPDPALILVPIIRISFAGPTWAQWQFFGLAESFTEWRNKVEEKTNKRVS